MAYRHPLSRTVVIDNSGRIAAGARLSFFDAGTTTPHAVYLDNGLATERANPVIADSSGRLPVMFLAGGAYRERCTDSYGTLLWDEDELEAVVTQTITIPPAPEALATGDIKLWFASSVPTGWVRCNGRTVGNALSGGTERANADTVTLFTWLWTNTSLTISGGKGASAAADFAANKTAALPDFRGVALIGLDDMGNTASGRLSTLGATATTLGAIAGEQTHALIEAELAAHDHTATAADDGGLTITLSTASGLATTGPNFVAYSTNGGAGSVNLPDIVIPDHTHAITVAEAGSGTAHNNIQPSTFVTWLIKL